MEKAVAGKKAQQKIRKGKDTGAFIREDDDAPMDLLDRSIAGRVTGQNPNANKRRRPGQDAADFKTDKESGRMIIDEDGSDQEPSAGDVLAGSAYQTAITSVDGMSRDARGRLKLNKANKRGRAVEAENDVDMLEGIMDDDRDRKKKARRVPEKLGTEFRSKVGLVNLCLVRTVANRTCHSEREETSNPPVRMYLRILTCRSGKPPSRKAQTRSISPTRSVDQDSSVQYLRIRSLYYRWFCSLRPAYSVFYMYTGYHRHLVVKVINVHLGHACLCLVQWESFTFGMSPSSWFSLRHRPR